MIVQLSKALFGHQKSYKTLIMPLVVITLLSRIAKCSYFAKKIIVELSNNLLVSYFLVELSNAKSSDMN